MKAVYYMRVSKDDQNCANQVQAGMAWARREECEIEYHTESESTRKTRPVKEALMARFRAGDIDTIVVARLDRFARSNIELCTCVQEIVDKGGRFVAIANGFDFCKKNWNASNQLMFQIFSAFAEFEREIIRERTNDGIARAKAAGKHCGRPFGCHTKWRRNKPPLISRDKPNAEIPQV